MGDLFLQIILFVYHSIALQNLGLTIIVIAIITRVIFFPFIRQQTHYSKKMSELQPHLSALKAKHKNNQQEFARAQMELFREHGINPVMGCLPAIVQIIVLFGLLGAMNKILTMNLNTSFLVWNLAKPDAYKIANIPFQIPGLLVVLAALTQFIQTKMMLPPPPKVRKEDKPGEKKEKEDFTESFTQAQSSMVWMFPLMFLFFGTLWPSGLALYWTTSSILAIVQQYRISGWGGLNYGK